MTHEKDQNSKDSILLIEVGKAKKKTIRKLRDGEGELMVELVDTIVKDIDKARTNILPVIVLCELPRKEKKRRANLTGII